MKSIVLNDSLVKVNTGQAVISYYLGGHCDVFLASNGFFFYEIQALVDVLPQ